MERSDLLLTIAEIAIVFAGFASVVSGFRRQRSSADPRADGYRLRLMLERALSVVFFALLPFVPEALGLSDEIMWRSAAGVFLLWHVVITVVNGLRTREILEHGAGFPGRGFVGAVLVTELLIWISQLASSWGHILSRRSHFI
jgi:hypothetical protein